MSLFSRFSSAAVAARQSNGLPTPAIPADPVPALLAHQGAEEQAERPVWRPAYEYSEWITIGGTTGTYRLEAPYDSLCEVSVVAFTASDQASGTFSVGDPLAIANTAVYQPNSRSGWGLFPFWTAGALAIPYGDNWMPLPLKPTLVLSLTVAASHSAWVTVQFRRRINAVGVPAYSER